MHSNHATWETTLVVPEAPVDPVLATLLRIEALLTAVERSLAARQSLTASEPELDFDDEMNVIGTKKPAAKKKTK